MFTSIIYFSIFAFSINACAGKKYTNYTLYRAIPINNTQIDFLKKLNEFYDINFWKRPGTVLKSVDFVVNPSDKPLLLRDAERHGMYITTIIDDVQKVFDQQTVQTYIRRRMDSFNWNNYFRLEDIYHWLNDLAKKYPKKIELKSIGKSYERRDIMAVKIDLNKKKEKPKIMIEGGIHAREWIAPAFVTYLIYQVLHASESKDKLLKEVANFYEWFIIPVLNVDGYEYTHTDDRLWRKNRNGHGIDLNRNFGYAFGTHGISRRTKSEVYCGTEAFSEVESKVLAKFVKVNSKNLKYYISFHSYGQYMILPYANTLKHEENYDEVYKMVKRAAHNIKQRYETEYELGTAYDTVGYLTSGGSSCWVKHTYKVPYVVTFELRDSGYYGFALPPEQILPTCKETMDGLIDLFASDRKRFKMNYEMDSQDRGCKMSDNIVMIFNAFFFIMVRFD